MDIDVQHYEISITNYADLQAKHILQFKYWKFAGNDRLIFSASSKEERDILLVKLMKYCTEKSIMLRLSNGAQIIINKVTALNDQFTTARRIGEKIKKGEIDAVSFQNFERFCSTFPRQLKKHQLLAAYHLYSVINGANFSVPGSGKTSTILSVYEKLKEEGKANTLFVIGPISCFGPWKDEFKKTLGRLPTSQVLAGGATALRKTEYYATKDSKSELYLTTFQTLINDIEDAIHLFLETGINIFLVIDEAHYIKRLEGKWAKAVLRLASSSAIRCILTGTPIPRSHEDVYNIFDLLWPNCEVISTTQKRQIKLRLENSDVQSANKLLQESIGSLFYRVRKCDLGLTEPEFHKPVLIRMNKYERKIYNSIHQKIGSFSSEDEYVKNAEILEKLKRGRIIRLRQAASYIRLLSSALEEYDESLIEDNSDLATQIKQYDSLETPAKIEYLLEFLQEKQRNGEKVVVWSNFVGSLHLIKRHCLENGYRCEMIYGETPRDNEEETEIKDEKTRENIRDEFVNTNSGLNILIANPAACAESISLHTTCHHALYYDLSYNCAQFLQSLDRIHRVGGSENVIAQYHFLQYEDSIDQDIKENLDLKAKRMYDVIESDLPIFSEGIEEEDASAFDRIFYSSKQI